MAIVAPAKRFGSIKESPETTKAKIATAPDIANIVPIRTSLANCVAAINPTTNDDNKPTIAIPFTKFLAGIKPKIPANIPINITITVNGTIHDVDGSVYMESTANAASFVFTNSDYILSTSAIDVYVDTWGDNPDTVAVDGTAHTCTVTFGAAKTRQVRIYIK